METTSFVAFARRFFGKQQNGSDKRRKTMKLLKNLVMLATLGMSATVHADGWLTIKPGNIEYIRSDPQDHATVLVFKAPLSLSSACGSGERSIAIFTDDPRHDQIYSMIMTALLAERKLEIYVLCDGSGGRFGNVALY